MTIGLPGLGYKSQGSPFYGQICIGDTEMGADGFINLFKSASIASFGSNATPANLDTTGYPVSTFSDVILFQFARTPLSTGPYIMSWPAGRSKFKIVFFGITATSTAHTNCTVNNDGGNNWGVTGDGTNAGSVTFSFASVGASMQFYFDGNGGAQPYAPGSGDMTLMRTSDVSAFNQGEIFTPELITDLRALSPKILRMMPIINNGASNLNSEVKWKYRLTQQHFAWRAQPYNPTNYAGVLTAAGAGQYPSSADQLTAAAASDSPLTGWVDGEYFTAKVPGAVSQFNVTGIVSGTGSNCKVQVSQSTANLAAGQQIWLSDIGGTTEANGIHSIVSVDDGTHFTINVTFVNTWSSNGNNNASVARISMTGKSGGAKFISSSTGAANVNLSIGLTGFHYDALLDRVIQADVVGQPPVEVQVALANKLKCDLWANIPYMADSDFVTQWATLIRDTLNPASVFYPEYSNEMDFNNAFPQWAYAFNAATILGFPGKNREFLAYKIKKYLGEIVGPIWVGRSNQLRRVMALQYVPSNTDTNIWKGNNLSAFGYNVSPNRPIDAVECIAYAPYCGGRNLSGGADLNFVATAKQASWYQSLVTAWDGGQTATAIALVDDDIRQGRCAVQNLDPSTSGTTFATPSAHGFTANVTCVQFQVTGGTTYSGVATNQTYRVISTPTSTTFTIQNVALSTINAGSAGTGTTTVGDAGICFNGSFQTCWTILGFANCVTVFWEALATGFDADRPAGMLPLKVCWYEGSLQIVCPDVTGLGLTGTNPTASINAAILAWRNSTSARDAYIAYCRQFMGTDSAQVSYKTSNNHALSIANLTLGGGSQYAFMTGGPGSSRYKTFDGFASFSANG